MQDLKSGLDPVAGEAQTPKEPASEPVVVGRVATWRYAINRRCAALLARVIAWLDRNADRQGGEWGARMEYKRRYTNPDEAVRARGPLPERRKGERRS